ncbi:MAG: hypothetical protein PW735_04365 [Acidobacteriaceae bacterium]|nr:hypothetical protein [Acidobacteriaceae bacterium]
MAVSNSQRMVQRVPGEKTSLPMLALLAGWLVPGAGHVLVRKPIRAALLFVAIGGMYVTGLALQGKVYSLGSGDIFDMLGFVGQLGSGILFMLTKTMGWGAAAATTTLSDYGSKFLICAGLLNLIAAVDAHSLASGRKAS